MKKIFLLGIIILGALSNSLFGVEKLNLDSKKYPMIGMYLEGTRLTAKVQRQNMGIALSGMGGAMLLSGAMTKNERADIRNTYLALGGIYVGTGIFSYFMKSKNEIEIDGYLSKISKEEMTVEEREKIAEETLEKNVKELQNAKLITGGIFAGSGILMIFNPPKTAPDTGTGMGLGLGLGFLGVYAAFFAKSPDEVFLESYKAEKMLENRLSLDVEPMNDGAKMRVAYSF